MPEPRRALFVGLATLDVVHRVDRLPEPNEKVTSSSQFVAAGGPAANAAVTFAGLGGRARLLTSLGRGVVADTIRADLEAASVEVIDVGGDQDPAVSAVVLDSATGERQVVSIDGAAADVVPPADASALAGVDAVMVDGHHPRLTVWAARAAVDLGIAVVADAGRWRPVFDDLLPLCTDVICSADFVVDGGVAGLHARGVERVAVSHGGDPIEWSQAGSTGTVEVPAVEAVDTLGAGDVLHGAFTFERIDPHTSFSAQLGRAARVAAFRCSRLGPRDWLKELPHEWKDAAS